METITLATATLDEKLGSRRASHVEEVLAELKASFDPEIKGEFKILIRTATEYGVSPAELADDFAVSSGTISRWQSGTSVPPIFVRKQALERVEKLLRSGLQNRRRE